MTTHPPIKSGTASAGTPAGAAPPRFSIVTVTFNNLAGLRTTRDSVAGQTFADREWIVVDGASKDGTAEAMREARDPGLVFVSEPDSGIYDAMNKGIALSRGQYVIFMNAGDIFADADVLAAVDARIGTASPDVVYGDSYEAGDGQRLYKPARRPAANRFVMFTHHQAIFYRRDHVQREGYDMTYRLSADWVMTTRILAKSGDLMRLDRPVCIFERGGISQRDDLRQVWDRELWRVYRREARWGLLPSAVLWLVKTRINAMRKLLPSIYDRVRYRKVGPTQGAR